LGVNFGEKHNFNCFLKSGKVKVKLKISKIVSFL